MVRVPWIIHPQAAKRDVSKLAWRPGLLGTGARPIGRVPIGWYSHVISGVPLTGGQAQGTIGAGGGCTLLVAPQGLGTTWVPAQVTLSTSTGVLDTSTAKVYLGPSTTPATLVGALYTGNGTVALAIPSLQPGQTLTVVWSGGHPGDTAAMNVTGTMSALSTE